MSAQVGAAERGTGGERRDAAVRVSRVAIRRRRKVYVDAASVERGGRRKNQGERAIVRVQATEHGGARVGVGVGRRREGCGDGSRDDAAVVRA